MSLLFSDNITVMKVIWLLHISIVFYFTLSSNLYFEYSTIQPFFFYLWTMGLFQFLPTINKTAVDIIGCIPQYTISQIFVCENSIRNGMSHMMCICSTSQTMPNGFPMWFYQFTLLSTMYDDCCNSTYLPILRIVSLYFQPTSGYVVNTFSSLLFVFLITNEVGHCYNLSVVNLASRPRYFLHHRGESRSYISKNFLFV